MPVTKEVLIERVRYLRDKQRFYEGFAAVLAVLYGLGISVASITYRVITFAIALGLALYATYRHRLIELEVSDIWREVMKDPKPERFSIPLAVALAGIPLLIISILQLIGIIPK